MTTTLKSSRLTLSDLLSHLTPERAYQLLGHEGRKLIQQGRRWDINIDEDVYFKGDLLRVSFGREGDSKEPTNVTITLISSSEQRLHYNCTSCDGVCGHIGAAFAMILESKLQLGLSEAPPERVPAESLSEQEVVEVALKEREDRAKNEKIKVKSSNPEIPWTDYTVTSTLSGKSYRVALRGEERGISYCSCPDFRTNRLGTCKHILHVLKKTCKKFSTKKRAKAYKRKETSLHLEYGENLALKLGVPDKLIPDAHGVIGPIQNASITDLHDLFKRISKLQKIGHDVTIYPDAEEFIQKKLFQERIEKLVQSIRVDPEKHPLRKKLLKAELLPYQLDGIAFAVGAGRAILADDMGLGKTIQGIGVAELLRREAEISRVLVICPASLKSQWRNEAHKFGDLSCQLVMGKPEERAEQYQNGAFLTICNYEQVLRDHQLIEDVPWDLIILDEGQRIKNWEAKTSRLIKSLKSTYALVLTGTPLENRLDDLYSIVQFVDDRRLEPAYRFFNRHRVVDEKGRVLGYKNLTDLRETLRPILLRRTRSSVMKDLPERTDEVIRITPTDEQAAIHYGQITIVNSIIHKSYLTEMDLIRLRQALLMCRMVADGTYLVNKEEPNYSTKMEELERLLGELYQEEDRKIILFSEWTTQLNLTEKSLVKMGHAGTYVRLDGSVPQKKRAEIVHQFQNNPDCRLILMTNAGSTGLNLQAANTVINVDLPWNPAVLEQRIGRAHRMGQKRPVQVFILVTEDTLEERLLTTLASKQELAHAALDVGSDIDSIDLVSGMQELKNRLEVLLGALPEAPVDVSEQLKKEEEARRFARREQISTAGGELLGAAFNFLGELLPEAKETVASKKVADQLRENFEQCIERDETGAAKLTVTLSDPTALDNLVNTLARLMNNSNTTEAD